MYKGPLCSGFIDWEYYAMRISRIVGRLALTVFLTPLSIIGAASADDGAAVSQALQWVTLTAVVVPGAQPLPDTDFAVTPLGSSAQPVVAKSSDKPAAVQLPAGRYKVVASYGDTRAEREITVGSQPASHQVNLNAGTVNLKLIKHVGGPTLKSGVTWEILTYGRDAEGKRHYIADSEASQPRFTLPHGFYLARATVGTQEVRHTIEVTAGTTYNYKVILQ